MGKKILITQSNYIPWKGYFDAMNLVDEVILYDSVQFTKRDWRNRNLIKSSKGLKWLTIPVDVKGKFHQSIFETKISNIDWNRKHWDIIKQNYSKSPYFGEYKDLIEDLYLGCKEQFLSIINYRFLTAINKILEVDTPIKFSSEFELVEGRTNRLVDICKKNTATDYFTGPSAKNYIDESLFLDENINLHYLDNSNYPDYDQLYEPFNHGVTILDLIFNTGPNAKKFMKTF